MQYKNWLWSRAALFVFVVSVGLVSVLRISFAALSGNGPQPQQDVIRLENRITQLEQRIFAVETSVRSVEQQSRLAGVATRGVSPQDLALLRSEIQTLQQRLAEDECAMARLDERTLTPAMRDARKKSGGDSNDQCRANFNTPLRFNR